MNDLDLYSQVSGDPYGVGDPFGPGMIDPMSFGSAMGGGGTMDDSAALAAALHAFSQGSPMQLPQLQPVTPQDPWEAMAMGGGAPQAPPMTPVLGGGTPIGSLGEALLHGADSFLGVPVAQGAARVQSRQAQNDMLRQAAVVAARNDGAFNRQAALSILRAHFMHRGQPVLANNIEHILGAAAKYGRAAGPMLATALGADTSELQPILDSLPEQGSVQAAAGSTPLTIDGRTVNVPNRALPGTLMGLQSASALASNRAQQTSEQTVGAIDRIQGIARSRALDELGLNGMQLTPKQDAAARAAYPAKVLEHATNLARAYEKNGFLPPGATDLVRDGVMGEQAPPAAGATGASSSTPPAASGPAPAAPRTHLDDNTIKATLSNVATRGLALQHLGEARSAMDDDSYRRYQLAIDRKYGRAKR